MLPVQLHSLALRYTTTKVHGDHAKPAKDPHHVVGVFVFAIVLWYTDIAQVACYRPGPETWP